MIASLLASPLTKGLALVVLLLASALAFTTNLYLGTRDDLSSLKTQYMQLQSDLMLCTDGKAKLKASAEQDDRIISQTQEHIKTIVSEKDVLLDKLRKLPNKNCPRTQLENSHEIEYVDIDAPFSDEFLKLFEQSDSSAEGSSDTSTR